MWGEARLYTDEAFYTQALSTTVWNENDFPVIKMQD